MLLELPVMRLQVQLDRMKPGLPPRRRYEPGVLRQMAALRVTPDGAVGVDDDGGEHLDVHNINHPRTRNTKGRNGISIMTTGDYAALRQRYGAHLVDGIAGESLLLDYAPGLAGQPLPPTLSLVGATPTNGAAEGGVISASDSAAGRLALADVHIAKPCVPFAQFCLRREDFEVDDEITTTLADLDGGARGYKMVASGAAVIRPGDVLIVDLPDLPVAPGL
jgi:hypothetical protein